MNRSWRQFARLFGTQFKITVREKQVWFWSIFYPVLLMVIFMVIFGGSPEGSFSAKVAVVKPQSNAAADGLAEVLGSIEALTIENEASVAEAEAKPKDQDIDAVLVLPESAEAGELKVLLHKEKQNSASS